MPDRFDLEYELSREDMLSASRTFMEESPEWKAATLQHRWALRRQTLIIAPVLIGGASFLIGQASATRGMYLEGAALGTLLAAVIFFGLPTTNRVERYKREYLEAMSRRDISTFVGAFALSVDQTGVRVRSPEREMKLSWHVVVPVTVGPFVLLRHGGIDDGTIVPPRAFASVAAGAEFFEHAQRWWQNARSERLTHYLADRDCPCPRCKYNLRGARGNACPECGHPLSLEALAAPSV